MAEVEDVVAELEVWSCSMPLEPPLSFDTYALVARHYVAARVTGRSGLRGECLSLSRGAPVDLAIADVLAPALLGGPIESRRETLAQLRAASSMIGDAGVMGRACSVLSVCLDDLAARAAGLPLGEAIGAERDALRASMVEGYALPGESDDEFVERLADRAAEGFPMLKLEAASYEDPEVVRRRLRELRAAVGDGVELVVDLAWSRHGCEDTLDLIEGWDEFGLAWVEDPFDRRQIDDLVRLRRRAGVPIGVGDEATDQRELRALLAAEAIDVLRLDVATIGGFAVATELAAEAAERGLRVSPHVHSELHEHAARAWDNCDHVEVLPQDRPFDRAHDLLRATTLDRVRDGMVAAPTQPGTGMELDSEAVARSAFRHVRIRPGEIEVAVEPTPRDRVPAAGAEG